MLPEYNKQASRRTKFDSIKICIKTKKQNMNELLFFAVFNTHLMFSCYNKPNSCT